MAKSALRFSFVKLLERVYTSLCLLARMDLFLKSSQLLHKTRVRHDKLPLFHILIGYTKRPPSLPNEIRKYDCSTSTDARFAVYQYFTRSTAFFYEVDGR